MDDQQIIQLYWDRNEQAIPVTSAKYGGYCASIANNILGNHEDTEECVNDALLNVWNSIPPHKPNNLATFLGKITRNLALNRYKQNTAQKRGGCQLPIVLDELSDCVSGKDDVEQEIDRRELLRTINSFLSTLPADKRSIFICRYWYFDGVSEIGARFRMTENHVSVTLNRLRQKLRRYLSERGFDL